MYIKLDGSFHSRAVRREMGLIREALGKLVKVPLEYLRMSMWRWVGRRKRKEGGEDRARRGK